MRLGRALLSLSPVVVVAVACGGSGDGNPSPSPSPTPCAAATSAYATAVTEWWIPSHSLAQNVYNNPAEALGPPNGAQLGTNQYTYAGFVNLGFGGHVTVDMGGCISDQPGNDIRVYQAVSSEPVSVYVSMARDGPFTLLLPFFQDCGNRVAGSRVIGFCDFDLASAAVKQARYIRVEDAEIYPCPCGTPSEGADLDAVQGLGVGVAATEQPVPAEQPIGPLQRQPAVAEPPAEGAPRDR
jgi:hypothetical protein